LRQGLNAWLQRSIQLRSFCPALGQTIPLIGNPVLILFLYHRAFATRSLKSLQVTKAPQKGPPASLIEILHCLFALIHKVTTPPFLAGTGLSAGGFARVYATNGSVDNAGAISLSLFLIVMTSVVLGTGLPFALTKVSTHSTSTNPDRQSRCG